MASMDSLEEMRALAAEANELRSRASDLKAAVERNAAELARVRGELLDAALRDSLTGKGADV